MTMRRPPLLRALRRLRALRASAAGAVLALSAGAAGCARDGVRVELQAQEPAGGDPSRLIVSAQVAGPQSGLRYRWFSVAGQFEPQESEVPTTLFTFARGTTRDRVSVEVWSDNARVAESEIDVKVDERRARAATQPMPPVQVEITEVPPYQPDGGSETRATIGGKVSGELSPDYKVVTYARADVWYIQPSPQTLHPIRADSTWSTWTHTGSSYAALVVRAAYDPLARLDVLPQVGGDVLARIVVEGKRP